MTTSFSLAKMDFILANVHSRRIARVSHNAEMIEFRYAARFD